MVSAPGRAFFYLFLSSLLRRICRGPVSVLINYTKMMHLKAVFVTLLTGICAIFFNVPNPVNALPLSSSKEDHNPRMVTLPLRRVALSRGVDIHPQIVSKILCHATSE